MDLKVLPMIKHKMLRFLAIPIAISALLPMAVLAQNKTSAEAEFSRRFLPIGDDDGDAITIDIQAKVRVSSLFGEPLVNCGAIWDIRSVNSVGGKPIGAVPAEVMKQVRLNIVKLSFPTSRGTFNIPSDGFRLPCDAGAMANPGSGKYSFNTPGSPQWSKAVAYWGFPYNYVPESEAKNSFLRLFEHGFATSGFEIDSVQIDLNAVKSWLREQEREKEKQTAEVAEKTDEEELFDRLAGVDESKTKKPTIGAGSWDEVWNNEQARVTQEAETKRKKEAERKRIAEAKAKAEAEQQEKLREERLALVKQDEALIPTKDETTGLYGYKDDQGNWLIEPKFEYAWRFSEGLAIVSDGKLKGFVDYIGNWVIRPRFLNAGPFREGLAHVKEDRLWGYIDSDGKWAIRPEFEEASVFERGVALVEFNERNRRRSKLINVDGRTLYRARYELKRKRDGSGYQEIQVKELTKGCRYRARITTTEIDALGNRKGTKSKVGNFRRALCLSRIR